MQHAPVFKLVADHVALDFANTLDNRYDPERTVDLIQSYTGLLAFCEQAGLLKNSQVQKLAEMKEDGKPSVLARAAELREVIERIFVAMSLGSPARPADTSTLNRYLHSAMEHRTLVDDGGSFRWEWQGLERDVAAPLLLIAEAASDLLISDNVEFVRQCGLETCRWLFLDLSRNHSRRWCDMKVCGNRAKSRNYYRKLRQ